MSCSDQITWIGPVSDDTSAGRVAREFVHSLSSAGCAVFALDTGDRAHPVACDLAGEVRAEGTLVVRQAPLSTVARTAAIVPLSVTAVNAAYVVVDTADDAQALDFLAACDEVWAPSFAQAEMLASLGVSRTRLFVIAPGVVPDIVPRAAEVPGARRKLLVIADDAVVNMNGDEDTEILRATYTSCSRDWIAQLACADAVVVATDGDPWGTTALVCAAAGIPLAHVASAAAAEYIEGTECTWFTADEARAGTALARWTWGDVAEQERAARLAQRIRAEESCARASRALLDRHLKHRTLPFGRQARVLAELGLTTPSERLQGSRAEVEILPVHAADGAWSAALAARLERPTAGTTIVLWVDESAAAQSARIGELAEEAIARSARSESEVDVLIVVAPLAHAPRERLLTSRA